MKQIFTTTSGAQTESLAVDVFKLCPDTHIFLLQGDLGAGKTTFVKGVARALGITELVTSPTFVVMRVFDVPDAGGEQSHGNLARFRQLCHVDLYRLAQVDEEMRLSLEEMMARDDVLVCVEWPERLDAIDIPRDAAMLEYEHIDEFKRRITLTCPPERTNLEIKR